MMKTLFKTITTAALVLALPATAFAAPKPKVQFSKNAYAVVESAGSATITVLRPRTGKALARISKQVSVDYAATAGSAVPGTDFTPVTGTVTFPGCATSTPPAGAPCLEQTFSVTVIDDQVVDGPKTVNLSLSNVRTSDGSRAILGFPSTAVLVIADDDTNGTPQPPTFQMATASDVVGEGAGSETAWVIRSGDLSSPASVDYATADGTAHNLVDYNSASGTLNFPAYDPNSPDPSSIIQGVVVTILHNPATTPPTSDFTVGLSGGTGVLGSPVSEDVTIVNEDGPPSVQWSAPSYSVAENGGPVHLTVFAAGSIGSEMDVDYATADGSALAGTEYTSQSDTL